MVLMNIQTRIQSQFYMAFNTAHILHSDYLDTNLGRHLYSLLITCYKQICLHLSGLQKLFMFYCLGFRLGNIIQYFNALLCNKLEKCFPFSIFLHYVYISPCLKKTVLRMVSTYQSCVTRDSIFRTDNSQSLPLQVKQAIVTAFAHYSYMFRHFF